MEYHKTVILRDGRDCVLRSAKSEDAAALSAIFNLTHGQTDYLLTYPDESDTNDEQSYCSAMEASPNEAEILAIVDGAVVGSAGIEAVGTKEKIRHRAEFGISVDKAYWGLGIGRALTTACVECAKRAGYAQLELDVVAQNERAIRLYERVGFVEYGRNPRGFRSRATGWQELVLMRLELDAP